jgi:hypothetical protein
MLEAKFLEKIKTEILYLVTFFENRSFYEIMWKKHCTAGLGHRRQYGRCALHAGYLRLQINTENVQYVFPTRQRWIYERASVLRYTYIACLVYDFLQPDDNEVRETCSCDLYKWINMYWHNPSGRTMALGLIQPLTEMSTRNNSWRIKAAGAWGWQPYHLHVVTVLKSGSLNLLEPYGIVQVCNGFALPLPLQCDFLRFYIIWAQGSGENFIMRSFMVCIPHPILCEW